MDEYTHYTIERDGEYLEHFGVKGMKWKKRKAKDIKTSEDPKVNKDFKSKDVDRKLTSSYEVKKRGPEYSAKWDAKNRFSAEDPNSKKQFRTDTNPTVTRKQQTRGKDAKVTYQTNYGSSSKRIDSGGQSADWNKSKKHKISAKDKATRFIKKLFGG